VVTAAASSAVSMGSKRLRNILISRFVSTCRGAP
jgi:hypothetical protein